jgi:hypothetical protein
MGRESQRYQRARRISPIFLISLLQYGSSSDTPRRFASQASLTVPTSIFSRRRRTSRFNSNAPRPSDPVHRANLIIGALPCEWFDTGDAFSSSLAIGIISCNADLDGRSDRATQPTSQAEIQAQYLPHFVHRRRGDHPSKDVLENVDIVLGAIQVSHAS